MQIKTNYQKATSLIRLKKSIPFSDTLNRYILLKSKEVLKELEKQSIKVQFVDGQPYENFEELKKDFNQNKSFKVSKDFSENTIFGDPYINYLNRVFHDYNHLRYNLSFSEVDELKLHYFINIEALSFGLNTFDLQLLNIDNVGQIVYFASAGSFPVDQRKYVISELIESFKDIELCQ